MSLERIIQKNSPKQSPEKEESGKEDVIRTPFHTATLQAFAKELPEKATELEAVLTEIDRQAVENFSVYESEAIPGVSFSYSKLAITPEIVQRFATTFKNTSASSETVEEQLPEDTDKQSDAKQQDYFLFTGFNPPPGGNAFTVQDVAIDRFIRLLPQVANSMRTGVTPPNITIYMLGGPTGLGGTVTTGWLNAARKDSIDADATLYAEFIERHAHGGDNASILLQGVSRGALVAQKTSSKLPNELQKISQRLLDNPAGEHERGSVFSKKGRQVAAGFLEELQYQGQGDIMKTLSKEDAKFREALVRRKGLKPEGAVQKVLKLGTVAAEAFELIRGTSLDTEKNRSYIRRGLYDPTTFSKERLEEVNGKEFDAINAHIFKRGAAVEAPFKGRHFFMYDRYKHWEKVLDFVKKTNA